MVPKPLKLIQCPACGDLMVEDRPCRYCEPEDEIIAGLRRRERKGIEKTPARAIRPTRLVPRLRGLFSLGR
jgi:hypothetical protein